MASAVAQGTLEPGPGRRPQVSFNDIRGIWMPPLGYMAQACTRKQSPSAEKKNPRQTTKADRHPCRLWRHHVVRSLGDLPFTHN
jgi:hypothetical protein